MASGVMASTSNSLPPSATTAAPSPFATPQLRDGRLPQPNFNTTTPRKRTTAAAASSAATPTRAAPVSATKPLLSLWEARRKRLRFLKERKFRVRGMRSLVGFKDGRRFAWSKWQRLAYHHSLVKLSLRRLLLVSALTSLYVWLAWCQNRTKLPAGCERLEAAGREGCISQVARHCGPSRGAAGARECRRAEHAAASVSTLRSQLLD